MNSVKDYSAEGVIFLIRIQRTMYDNFNHDNYENAQHFLPLTG